MSDLPDTTRARPRRRTTPILYVVAILAVALLAVAYALFAAGADGPATGEEVYAAGVEDIAAGTEDAPFPSADASRFDRGTRAVRVYLRLEDAPAAGKMVATVERSGKSSVFSRIFDGPEVRAGDGGEGRLTISKDGASGVVYFVVGAADGGALPDGEYGVEVRFVPGEDQGAGRPVARKYFRIGDPQT